MPARISAGGDGFVQDVLVAVGAEGGEVCAHALQQGIGHGGDPAVEQFQPERRRRMPTRN